MRKLLIATASICTSLLAAEIVPDGMIKAMYLQNETQNAFAFGGKLGVEASNNAFFSKAAFYTVTALLHPEDAKSNIFTSPKGGYTLLGEAAAGYKNGAASLLVGRQWVDTPLIGHDDGRIVPNLFEGVSLKYAVDDKTKLQAYYLARMSGFWSQIFSGEDMGNFVSMSKATGYGDVVPNSYVAAAGLTRGTPYGTLGVWGYRCPDLLESFYADFKTTPVAVGSMNAQLFVQGAMQRDIGSLRSFLSSKDRSLAQSFGAAKLSVGRDSFSFFVAATKVSDSNGRLDNNMMNVWGGIPQYTVSNEFVMKSFNTDGATMYKYGASYKPTSSIEATANHLIFIGSNKTKAKDQSLGEFILEYKPYKNFLLNAVLLINNVKDSDSLSIFKSTIEYRF